MDKKEIIKMLMKKYGCNYIKIISDLDVLKSGIVSNLEAKIIFDIKNNKDARYLLIKDTITKDNIYLYYEFLEKEDIKTSFQSCENCLYRHKKVYKDYDTIKCELDNFSNLDLKNQIGDKFCNKWEYKK